VKAVAGENPLRGLPSVDAVIRDPQLARLLARHDRAAVLRVVRAVLAESRDRVLAGAASPAREAVAAAVIARLEEVWGAWPRPVLNATGVILHTNLGRAPLSPAALKAIRDAAAYSDLELDLDTGLRSSRHRRVAAMVCDLTGAQAALVTTNAASALTLALAAVARGKEVIVSRGQAVEIGGGVRIPQVLRQSGARLVEVGTTNKTRLQDYAEAITPRTAAILHVHTSNFRMIGFTETVEMASLAELAHARGILLLDDNGSGSLVTTEQFGLAHEPMPVESLEAGADVVTFSGDKLLGGPQAGILLARREIADRAARHPLSRAMRPDKTALAALAATLRAYYFGDAVETLPLWRMISAPAAEVAARAERFRAEARSTGIEVALEAGESTIGGGALPGEVLPTTLAVLPAGVSGRRLRTGEPRVVPRQLRNRVALDFRTVPEDDDDRLLAAVSAAWIAIVAEKNQVVDSAAR